MYFYVDESGHTGTHLFDENQPILCYGLLSSRCNLDAVASSSLTDIRRRLGVDRLHANELGLAAIDSFSDKILALQKRFDLRFDLYRILKGDYALISFFDQVFDQGVNPAVPWTGYWTPLRYVLLEKVAYLFDLDLAKRAWAARIERNSTVAEQGLVDVCRALRGRLSALPDSRSRQIIEDTLAFVERDPAAIHYNAKDREHLYQITPNLIGFQFVMASIAARIKKNGIKTPTVVVDQQTQFNRAQNRLADHYRLLSKAPPYVTGPGLPTIDFSGMPDAPIQFASSAASSGLELVDLYLWIFKRWIEHKKIPEGWTPIIKRQFARGHTDEISLKAISERWTAWFDQLPEPTGDQLERAKQWYEQQELRRLAVIANSGTVFGTDNNEASVTTSEGSKGLAK